MCELTSYLGACVILLANISEGKLVIGTEMNEHEARQLEKRINREAPHLVTESVSVTDIGTTAGVWAVYIYLPGQNEPLPLDNPADWEAHKSALRLS